MKILTLFILVFSTACATSGRSANDRKVQEKEGVLVTGEYSYFRSSDGAVFILRLPHKRDQKVFAALVPLTTDRADPCLRMRVVGSVNGDTDETGRPLLVVEKILMARKVDCGE